MRCAHQSSFQNMLSALGAKRWERRLNRPERSEGSEALTILIYLSHPQSEQHLSARQRTHEGSPPGGALGILSPVRSSSSSSTDVIMKSEKDIMTNMRSTIRQPSAFLPVAMSLVALSLVLGHVALFGVVHEADEGAAAHLWQILMAAQVPIMAFFAIKYLPQKPKQALLILALQIVAALTACAPVFFLKL